MSCSMTHAEPQFFGAIFPPSRYRYLIAKVTGILTTDPRPIPVNANPACCFQAIKCTLPFVIVCSCLSREHIGQLCLNPLRLTALVYLR